MKSFILVACVLLLIVGCKKTSAPKPEKHGMDVYILGQCGVSQNATVGGYWKNGVFNALTDTNTFSYARSMTTNGSDVYVAGYYLTNFSGLYNAVSAYWKNGVVHSMSDAASVNCVTVNGSDIYIGGASYNGNGIAVATYWKNGVKHVLDINSFTSITSIFIKGNNVYTIVSGSNIEYWLNDKFISDADIVGNDAYGPRGSYFDGNYIYFSGQRYSNAGYIATYWKNGNYTQLGNSTSDSQATSIEAVGTDVFFAGYIQDSSGGLIDACYWKNGNFNKLDNFACANGIAINGTDLYIGGYTIDADINHTQAVYWLNGERKNLSNPYYKPNGVNNSSLASQVIISRY